jgi:hypothetical protein
MTPENILEKDNKEITRTHYQSSSISPAFVSAMIVGIIVLIILIHVGFFETYIKFFPKFEDATIEGLALRNKHFTTVMHFHGMMMMGWVLTLLVQPILIRKGKMNLHRLVGRLSYVLAPLVVLSIFLVNQGAYHNVLNNDGKAQAVALIALTFPGIVFFSILYFLAIRYRHRPALHMRFMCSTAFLLIPPALDRALIVYLNLPGFDVGSVIVLTLIGTVTIIDSIKTKRLSPFALIFAFEVLHIILWHSKTTALWQEVGGVIAKLF